jgi:uncharacterized protein
MEEQTKNYLNKTFILASVLVAGILLFFMAQIGYQNKVIDQQNSNQITVSGEGKVYAKPDVAVVSLGVTTDGLTVAEVTKNNTEKMNAVIDAIKALKIDEKDIQTTNYSLTPYYDREVTIIPAVSNMSSGVSSSNVYTTTATKKILKYTLSQNVQVKIRDFAKVGDVLSNATAKGANLVGDLQFTIDNPEKLKEEARAKAIDQAKANAKNLAKESGISLGKIINVYENSYGYSANLYSAKAMGAGVMAEAAPVPTIQPGQQEINVTINLTYKVR